MHFPIMHGVPMINKIDRFPEWCPFPFNHNTPLMKFPQSDNFNLTVLGISLITTIIFFYFNKKVKWIMALTPIIIVVLLMVIGSLMPT